MPETRLEARLKATSAVTDLVGARIFPIRRYQGKSTSLTGLPAVTYQRTGTNPQGASVGTVNVAWAQFQINCVAKEYSDAKAIGDAVLAALSGWSDQTGTPKIDQCNWQNTTDAPEQVPDGQSDSENAVMHDFLVQYKIT